MVPRRSKSRGGRIVILFVCMLCCSSVCLGHDLVGGALYKVRHALFGWMSRSPDIDEGLRRNIRENVLVCIGASNRQDAENYDKRHQASGNLGKDLSKEELKLLYSFLDDSLGGRDPLWSQDILLIKASICTFLNWDSGARPPDGFGLKLKEMIGMRTLDLEWRRDCSHHLVSYYEAKWKHDAERMSSTERKVIEEFLISLAKDKHFAPDIVEEITYLSKTFSEIKAAMEAHQITPFPDWDPAPSKHQ